jgi:hypothetical protein
MEYSKIVAVTGLPGLFELINSKTDGAIVRSLDDKSTRFVSSRIHHFSHLESIEVYTQRDNVNLVEILKAMDGNGGKLPDEKDTAAIRNYFEKVYPELDFDRVYPSDMKKMVKWFDVLKKNNIELKLTEIPEEEPEPEIEEVEEEVKPKKEKKPAAAAAPAKKAAAKSADKKPSAAAKPAAKKSAKPKEEKKDTKKDKPAAKKSGGKKK